MLHSPAVVLSAVALVLAVLAGAAPTPGSWLDSSSFEAWNTAGVALPSAPAAQNPDPRCHRTARSPESDEDRQLHARGWDLMGPASDASHIRVIGATADYDGMCRPRRYQYFVFRRGEFAGTLSPVLMDSRTDGALSRVTIESVSELKAEYFRYAPADPLCCPSAITTVRFSLEGSPALLEARSADTVARRSPPAR
jgi:LppP/LprE lipoprotein